MPITPAPTTTIDDGMDLRSRIPSESRTRFSSNSTPAGLAGFVPVATMMLRALSWIRSARVGSSTTRGVWVQKPSVPDV